MVRMEKKNCWETDGGIERISNLPDVGLEHILSFLSTKEAVETCILSERWNRTWARVSILDINYDEFRMCTNYEEREAKFVQFVKGVLQNRDPLNLDKFKLVWYEDKNCASFNYGVLESCILQAMKFKPRVFFLSVLTQELLSFGTDSIFTCESLHDVVVENNLKDSYLEIAPSSVHLLYLKKLHLTHVTVNDDFKDKLFIGCPILEELFLRDCSLNICTISSGKLKKLVIFHCCLAQYLKICTPVLLDLDVGRCFRRMLLSSWVQSVPTRAFSWENMTSLVNAKIEFPNVYYADEFPDVGFKLLTNLSNITRLDLQLNDRRHRGLVEKEVPSCPTFNNLKTLRLGSWCMCSDFELVAYFLHSPNLHKLTLCNYNVLLLPLPGREDEDEEKWMKKSPEEIRGALFQREQLEIVKIVKWLKNDAWINRLVSKLHAHVKTIGKIIITNYN